MTNSFVIQINLVHINDNGTIEVIDSFSWTEFSFTFQYKLYLPFEENLKSIFQLLFSIPPEKYELSGRFKKYVENRINLYEKVSKEYLPLIDAINSSKMSFQAKKALIEKIDLELNRLYPYEE